MTEKKRILIVDDEEPVLESIEMLLEMEGYEIVTARNVASASKLLETDDFNLIVSDIKMPFASGFEFVEYFKKNRWIPGIKPLPIILMTAYSDVKAGVDAVKQGVFDYIPKPFDNEEFKVMIKKALDYFDVFEKLNSIKNAEPVKGEIKGESIRIKNLKREITRISVNFNTILITGESGTGKELAARMIYEVYSSSNRDGESGRNIPFVPVNLSAIPDNLIESELFGYSRGAFTGANADKTGLLQSAEGGILFLDEIGDFPLTLQVKLLRFLQEKSYRKLGSVKEKSANIKIIAATNKDLESLVASGKFRDDLYFRLNKINLRMPSLREYKEDIPVLSAHFINKYSKCISTVSPEAMKILNDYDYPGNVRELENIIERACIYCESDMTGTDDTVDKEIAENCLPDFIFKNLKGLDKPGNDAAAGNCGYILQSLRDGFSEDEGINMVGEIFNRLNSEKHVTLAEFLRNIEKNIVTNRIKADNSKLSAAKGLGLSLRSLRYILSKKD